MEQEENSVQTEPVESETTENTPETTEPEKVEDKSSEIEAKNKQLFERAKKAEAEAKAARLEAERLRKASTKSLDVEDYIDISASLEGLDQREKSRLAEEHRLTGKPLKEIRQSEDYTLWQSAYRAKVEKDRTLAPSNRQSEEDRTISLDEALSQATTQEEREKLLQEHLGYSVGTKYRPDRTKIGG